MSGALYLGDVMTCSLINNMHVPTMLASQFDAHAINGERFLYLYVKVIIVGLFVERISMTKCTRLANPTFQKNAIHTVLSLDLSESK